MNGTDHQNATTTQARADIRALLAAVRVKPHVALSVLAELFIGKSYAGDRSRRLGKTQAEVWPGRDVREMADDVYEALEWHAGELSDLYYPMRLIFEEGEAGGRRRYRPENFEGILDWLRGLDLSTSGGRRLAASAFDEAVRFMVRRDGDALGPFVTPEPVADLMVELADPLPGERVCDPCFGFGELLVGAVRRLRAAPGASSRGGNVRRAAIAGVELSLIAYPVGLCRLVLAGVDRLCLEYGDALVKPLADDRAADGYDCLLASPPWGSRESTSVLSDVSHFPFPSDHAEDLFLQHGMESLRPGGRAVVAVPEELLFRTESLALRKGLLSEYHVEGVVALPAGAFAPFTGIPISLVVVARAEPCETVRFVSVSPMAWEAAMVEAAYHDDGQEGNEALGRRFSHGELLREISELIGRRRELSEGTTSPGVETWDVPVEEIVIRDYELLAKKSGSEALSVEIDRLLKANPSLRIEPLESVADIDEGQTYDSDEVTERHPENLVGGVLRPSDLTEAGIRSPSLFLNGFAFDYGAAYGPAFLRAADLLVPMTETIGAVGYIEESTNWAGVMANDDIALVRVRDGLAPEFLVALLRSPAYWFWLSGHAAGSTIRRLSVDVLRTLPIPVPPPAVQETVLRELPGTRGDALAVLHRLFSEISEHPVAAWLETPMPSRLAVGGAAVAAGHGIGTLAEIGQGLGNLSQQPAAKKGDRVLDDWLAKARRAAAALDGIDSIPPGSGRLVILEFALARLHESLTVLRGVEGVITERLSSVTSAMAELAEQEVYAMLHRSDPLDIDVEPTEVIAGDASEVVVRARNASVAPLRNVRLTARRPDGTTEEKETDYVAERGTYKLPMAIRPTGEARSLQIAVDWQAHRFDGAAVRGDAAVSLLVRENRAEYRTGVEDGDLGDNPYIVGSPVDRHEMFFGRAGKMDQIRRQLGDPDRANVILLEGNRRTGKTSILRQLGKADALPGWIPVYCSLQAVDSVATADVFRLLALRTGWTLADAGIKVWIPDQPQPDPGRPFKLALRAALHGAFSDGHPFETLEVYLTTAIEAAKPRGLLLMLDEFDKLQEGIDMDITSPQVPENIRHLLQHQPGLGAIITGSRRLKRLREEYWSALFGIGYRIGVSALPVADARKLVTEPVEGRLHYLPQARDRLVELCASHPFLIQTLCSRVFDQAATGSHRTITLDVVKEAATEMVEDNEHFRTLWEYAGSDRRRLILALCERLADGPDAVDASLLRTKFGEYGIPVRCDRDLADDVAELRELELIDLDTSYRSGTYRLSIPLMAMWLKRNVDFEDLVVHARQKAADAP